MTEYQIIKNQYIDGCGNCHTPYFTIRYKVPFLFRWWRWKFVKHMDCGWGDCYYKVTNFKTLEDAQSFANKFICGGGVYDGTKTEIVEHTKCK